MILVIVAVLVVAAAIAIPFWRNQAISSHISEAMKSMDAAKLVVMEAATMRGGLARVQPGDFNYNASASANPYVANVAIDGSGRITLTTRDTGADPDPVLLLTPRTGSDTGVLHWDCSMLAGNSPAMSAICPPSFQSAPPASKNTAPTASTSAATTHSN
jgi:type IV pilus assembly protein PilA